MKNRNLVNDKFLSKIVSKSNFGKPLNENRNEVVNNNSVKTTDLAQKVDFLSEQIVELKNIIEQIVSSSTIINENEGDGELVHMILKGHHFKGNMSVVKKK